MRLDFLLPAEAPVEAVAVSAPTEDSVGPPSKGKRRGVKRPRLDRRAAASGQPASAGAVGGNSTVGDDLGWDKERNLDMNGG